MLEAFDIQQDKRAEEIADLAQKLYNDDGHAGNLAKTSADVWRKYDERAAQIVGERV